MEASRYFRLELDIAIRMRKPILVFFDERYGEMLCPPEVARALPFDIQEVGGRGGSPRVDSYRKAVTQFIEFVAASKALELARGKTITVGRVGMLAPAASAYRPEDIQLIRDTAQANQVAAVQIYPGAPLVDTQMHRWLATLDWLIADVGEASLPPGVYGYVHGAGIPVLRLYQGAASAQMVETRPAFRSLFGSYEVGYCKDIVFWNAADILGTELQTRIRRIREPTRRIATRDEAESYFRSASLRNEAVFVSYSGADREFGALVSNALKRRFQTVFDYRDGASIVPGQPWLKEIFDQLAKSALGVPLLSKGYVQSGNCQHELQEMVAKQDMGSMAIIPVKLGDDALEVPLWLQSRQYLRYGEYADVEAVADKIMQSFDARKAAAPIG
jgi:hypothetical protein